MPLGQLGNRNWINLAMMREFESVDSELISLAGLLSSRPITEDSYKLNELLVGLAKERKCLGSRKYLVVLNQSEIDIDGLTNWIFLYESFASKIEAIESLDLSANAFYEKQTAGPDEQNNHWRLESENEPPFLSAPKGLDLDYSLEVIHEKSYKLRATIYDTIYNSFRVLGPFRGEVVSKQLFSFLNDQFGLWSYFVDVGEAEMKGPPSRAPG
jgi:hypothetical protein